MRERKYAMYGDPDLHGGQRGNHDKEDLSDATEFDAIEFLKSRNARMATGATILGVAFVIGFVAYIAGEIFSCSIAFFFVVAGASRCLWAIFEPERPDSHDLGENPEQFRRRMLRKWRIATIGSALVLLLFFYLRFFRPF